MLRLPSEVISLDQLFQWLANELEPDDAFRLQQLLRDYDSFVIDSVRAVVRREMFITLMRPEEN